MAGKYTIRNQRRKERERQLRRQDYQSGLYRHIDRLWNAVMDATATAETEDINRLRQFYGTKKNQSRG